MLTNSEEYKHVSCGELGEACVTLVDGKVIGGHIIKPIADFMGMPCYSKLNITPEIAQHMNTGTKFEGEPV